MQKITDQNIFLQYDTVNFLHITKAVFIKKKNVPGLSRNTIIGLQLDIDQLSEMIYDQYQRLSAIAEEKYPLPALHYQNL